MDKINGINKKKNKNSLYSNKKGSLNRRRSNDNIALKLRLNKLS